MRRYTKPATRASLTRRATAESVGTAFLLVAVVGSGIMGERLSAGNVGQALLANSLATGAALIALILTFGPLSGAHFNPVVSITDAYRGGIAWRDLAAYLPAQMVGAALGVVIAHLMFGERALALSTHHRAGGAQFLAEAVATFGLICVVGNAHRSHPLMVPFAVASYITGAYWFTASTSFANPAVTLARSLTNTFTGIRPSDVPGFVAAQCVGAFGGAALVLWLSPEERT